MDTGELKLREVLRSLYHQIEAATSNQVIVDTEGWVKRQREKIGVYATRKGPWRQVERPEKLTTSEQTFSPILDKDSGAHLAASEGSKMWAEKSIGSWVQQEYATTLLRGASVYGSEGMVVSSDGSVLNEFYHGWSNDISSTMTNVGYGSTLTLNWREFSGSAAVLSVNGWDSYYHFLLQAMVRLKILKRHRHDIDKYIVPKGITSWHEDVMSNFGISEDETIKIGRKEKIMVSRLYAATIPMVEGSVSKYTVKYLRNVSEVETEKVDNKKVYVVRGNRRRRIENEKAIVREMEKRGWTVCDGLRMSFEEQVSAMSGAELIVGAHGAGMTNMVFSLNARVIEIFPSDHLVPNCYDHLAERCGHEYNWLVSGQMNSGESFRICRERLFAAIDFVNKV